MKLKAPAPARYPPVLVEFTFLVLLIVFANLAAVWVAEALTFEIRPSNEDVVHRMITIRAIVYAVLIAIPFVPGVEIGLALIGMLGPAIVFLVCISILAGLSFVFVAGRLVPLVGLIRPLGDLQLRGASELPSPSSPWMGRAGWPS